MAHLLHLANSLRELDVHTNALQHIMQDSSMLQQQMYAMEASLNQVRKECSRAVTAAQLVLGRPDTPPGSPRTSEDGSDLGSVEDAVRQLVTRLKVKYVLSHVHRALQLILPEMSLAMVVFIGQSSLYTHEYGQMRLR